MIILEKTVNYFLKNKVKLEEISFRLNQIGLINTWDESLEAIKVDVPTIRPDLNCVFGVLIEISALTDNDFSEFLPVSAEGSLDWWEIDGDVPVFIGCIKKEQIKESIPEITEMLICNKLYTGDKCADLIHFCALFFGVPPMLVSEKTLGKRIRVKENTVYGCRELKWGDRVADAEEDDLCLLVLLADPAKVKKDFDEKKKKADGLYYYYIRRGNAVFVAAFFQFMGIPFQTYQTGESRRKILSDPGETERILGIKTEKEKAEGILRRLGYRPEEEGIYIPQWRTDVQGSQEIAHDILRFMLAQKEHEKSSGSDGTERDDYTYYRAFMEQKMFYSDHGFVEVMSRPFTDGQELSEIVSYTSVGDGAVKVINPLNKRKDIIIPSLLVRLRKNLDVNDRVFEAAQVKYRQDGKIVEKNVIGAAGKYKNGDTIYPVVEDLRMFASCGGSRIEVYKRTPDCCVWKLISGDKTAGTVVFLFHEKNRVILLMEKDVEGKRKNGSMPGAGKGLARELSIDLPLVCPFQELEKDFFDENREIVDSFEIKESRLYRKNDVWMTNYTLKIFWKNIKKADLPGCNRILMEKTGALNAKYGV